LRASAQKDDAALTRIAKARRNSSNGDREDEAAVMSKDRMRYDLLVQDALRSVVKAALKRVAKEGLPGNHHFFISFRTDADGVDISDSLRAQYPEEMTIVLQHQFWGLSVDDEGFSVGLSFNQMQQTLRIPYHALTMFHDPAVQFQLPFQPRATTTAPSIGGRIAGETPSLPKPEANGSGAKPKRDEKGAVVSLDAFRKK
jgi:uncharacterized protein